LSASRWIAAPKYLLRSRFVAAAGGGRGSLPREIARGFGGGVALTSLNMTAIPVNLRSARASGEDDLGSWVDGIADRAGVMTAH